MQNNVSGFFTLATLTLALSGCATEQLRENTVTTGATTSDLLYEMALSNVAMERYYNGDDTTSFKDWNNSQKLTSDKLNDKTEVWVSVNSEKGPTTESGNENSSFDDHPLGTHLLSEPLSVAPKGKKKEDTPPPVPHLVGIDATSGDVLPWAYDVTGANIAVNDSEGITAGLSTDLSAAHVFHPSLQIPLSRTLQQSWAVSPVTDTIALNLLKGYYYNASIAKHRDPSLGYLYQNGSPPTGCLQGSYRDKCVWIPKDDPEALANLTHLVQRVMAAVEDADERAGARKQGNIPANTQPQVLIGPSRSP